MTRYVPNARVCVVWRAKVETRNTASHVITGIVHYVVSSTFKVKGGRELFAHWLPADQGGARLLVHEWRFICAQT